MAEGILPTRESVIQDAKAFVDSKFGGDWKKAFAHYCYNNQINKDGLSNFLREANIGGPFTRGTITDKIIEELDQDKDGWITLTEFESLTA